MSTDNIGIVAVIKVNVKQKVYNDYYGILLEI